jgi:hypothetical protein
MRIAKYSYLAVLAVVCIDCWPFVSVHADSERSYWLMRNEVAYTFQVFPEAKKPGATATLTVDFSSADGRCFPMFGLAVLEGSKFGSPGPHGMASGKMTVTVPGSGAWSDRPLVVKYSNGFEAAMPASAALLQALRVGDVVRIAPLPGSPTFEFSLFGASAALERAKRGSGVCH